MKQVTLSQLDLSRLSLVCSVSAPHFSSGVVRTTRLYSYGLSFVFQFDPAALTTYSLCSARDVRPWLENNFSPYVLASIYSHYPELKPPYSSVK